MRARSRVPGGPGSGLPSGRSLVIGHRSRRLRGCAVRTVCAWSGLRRQTPPARPGLLSDRAAEVTQGQANRIAALADEARTGRDVLLPRERISSPRELLLRVREHFATTPDVVVNVPLVPPRLRLAAAVRSDRAALGVRGGGGVDWVALAEARPPSRPM